jgi:hypothetical protein
MTQPIKYFQITWHWNWATYYEAYTAKEARDRSRRDFNSRLTEEVKEVRFDEIPKNAIIHNYA